MSALLLVMGGGTSQVTPLNVSHIKEVSSQLFVARGPYVTQVNPSTWAVVATKALSASFHRPASQ